MSAVIALFAGLAGRRWCEDCEAQRKQFKEMDDRAPLRTLYNSSCLHCVYVMPALCYAINYRTFFALRVRGRFPDSAHTHTTRARSSHTRSNYSRVEYSRVIPRSAPSTVPADRSLSFSDPSRSMKRTMKCVSLIQFTWNRLKENEHIIKLSDE